MNHHRILTAIILKKCLCVHRATKQIYLVGGCVRSRQEESKEGGLVRIGDYVREGIWRIGQRCKGGKVMEGLVCHG